MSARVAAARCSSYNFDEVFRAVKTAVDALGGMGSVVKPGSKVLLKPNLLSPRLPEEGVDTHPEVIRAVARLVRESGGEVSIGDSPGGHGMNVEEVYERSGVKKVAEEEGAELVRFNASRNVDGFPVSRHVLDADVLISIPKFKTHGITVLTAGVKNMFGVLPGMFKSGCHASAPSEEDLAKVLAKVYLIVRPELTVLDAVVSMEGDGPASGDLRRTNFVMASSDAVAMDAVLAKIVGLEPLDLAVTRVCYEEGLGEVNLDRIEIVGDNIDSLLVPNFKLPKTSLLKILPKSVAGGLASLVKFKPVIDKAACKRCNLCKLSCPVEAITITPDRCVIDYVKCVRCLCCHEVCPYRAIYVKRNIVAKVVWG